MVVAVTGASGHVGGNLIRSLLEKGDRVRALVRVDTRAIEGLDVERVKGDVLDPGSLGKLFEGAELVFHLAALISIDGDHSGAVPRINVDGTKNVLAAARNAGVRRVVHMSSIHALADVPKGRVIDETCDLAIGPEFLAYDRSKAQAEVHVQEAVAEGLEVVTLNPGGIIGREDYKPSAMGEVLLALYHGRMPALVRGGFGWVDIRDVAAACVAAAEKGKAGDRYVLVGHWATFRELADLCEKCTGKRAPRVVAPPWLAAVGAPFVSTYAKIANRRPLYTSESLRIIQHHRNPDSSKAQRELGFSPFSLAETIEDAYAWFDKSAMLA